MLMHFVEAKRKVNMLPLCSRIDHDSANMSPLFSAQFKHHSSSRLSGFLTCTLDLTPETFFDNLKWLKPASNNNNKKSSKYIYLLGFLTVRKPIHFPGHTFVFSAWTNT